MTNGLLILSNSSGVSTIYREHLLCRQLPRPVNVPTMSQSVTPVKHLSAPAAQAVTHYENFPVASFLCPAHLRPAIAAIYHFARTADDLADEGSADALQRLADLQAYRADLLATASGPVPAVELARPIAGQAASAATLVLQQVFTPTVDHLLLGRASMQAKKATGTAG
jgi:phytoene/squalene synthetase